jgi:DNA-binding transcriptional LysR family regulator
MKLSDAGHVFLEHARAILAGIRVATDEVRVLSGFAKTA